MTLEGLRQEISALDRETVHLLARRMELSWQVAEYKRQRQLPVLDEGRENQVLNSVAEQAGEELAPFLIEIYRAVMAASRAYQGMLLDQTEDGSEIK